MIKLDLSADDRKKAKELADALVAYINEDVAKKSPTKLPVTPSLVFGYQGDSVKNMFQTGDTRWDLRQDKFDIFCTNFSKHGGIDEVLKIQFQEWRDRLTEEYKKLKEEAEQAKLSSKKETQNSSDEFVRTSILKTLFENTRWFCYSRLQDGSLGRRTFEFGEVNPNDQCPVTIGHFYLNDFTPFQGIAKCSGRDRTLLIEAALPNRNPGDPSGFSCHLFAIGQTIKLVKLCVGHLCFCNIKTFQIVSYTQVMIRYNGAGEDFVPARIEQGQFETGDLKTLAEFLIPEEKNQIITPAEALYDIDDVRRYLNSQ
jgi:hypothetical protein